jgi:hypothetical protein
MTPGREWGENQDKSQIGKTESYHLVRYIHSPWIHHIIEKLKSSSNGDTEIT